MIECKFYGILIRGAIERYGLIIFMDWIERERYKEVTLDVCICSLTTKGSPLPVLAVVSRREQPELDVWGKQKSP